MVFASAGFAEAAAAGGGSTAIRPFHIHVPDSQIADLQRRLDRDALARAGNRRRHQPGCSAAADLEGVGQLCWTDGYDWRKCETYLNGLPQFVTEVDGLDIHFIHVRSRQANALPIIITHGWPGSIIEQLKVISTLTDPTAHGGVAADAFDVVIPSLPGHGFSGKPSAPGWDPIRIARAWTVLMARLGYTRYVAQGGDWGNAVTEQMALLTPPGLVGIHTNMPATLPPEISKALAGTGPAPTGLTGDELQGLGAASTRSGSTGLGTPRRWRTGHRRSARWPTRPSA